MTTRIDEILIILADNHAYQEEVDLRGIAEAKLALKAECLKMLPEKHEHDIDCRYGMGDGACVCEAYTCNQIIDDMKQKLEQLFEEEASQ